MSEILVPTLGESVSEATVAKWLKKVGDAVAADEPLVELETDKVTLEVNAPAAGTLTEISQNVGAGVKVGQVLGQIAEGAAASAPKAAPAAAPVAAPAPAPAAAPVPPVAASAATPGPAARKALAEAGLSADAVAGSGKDGRVTKADVAAAKAAPAASAPATPAAPAAPMFQPVVNPNRSNADREERMKMSRLRQRIAERLKSAQNTAAILTTFNEVDMTNVIALRNAYKDKFEKQHGIKLGFMSFFVKAAIKALKEIPEVNAEIEGDELVYKNYYDIGVAVGTPNGLVVPVLRDADQMSFAQTEKTIADFGVKARDGKLTVADMTGGTFTISNGGVYGSLMSTPIINPPQSGILGMHKTMDRPVAINGKVEIRPMMYIALSYDHRIIDGREAVTFLVRIKEMIEDPQRLLLEV